MKSRIKSGPPWFMVICIGTLLVVLASIAYRLSLIFTTDWKALLASLTVFDWILTFAVISLLVVAGILPIRGKR